MNAFFLHFVTVLSSAMLVLPPGSCCGVLADAHGDVAKTPTSSCCRGAEQESPAETPDPKSVECCCTHEGTLPEKPTIPAQISALVLSNWAANLPLANLGRHVEVDSPFALSSDGPPLRVLQCVWLC